jgi:hypothetical protein
VDRLNEVGEIGTHVHFRNENGVFNSDVEFQKILIENATDYLRNIGFDIQSFRGGDHFFNNDTLKILENLNYSIDSSVMQGFSRIMQDNFSVNHCSKKKEIIINKPYFMSYDDYLVSGNSPILEIPVTNLLFFLKKPNFFLPFPVAGNNKIGPISNFAFSLTKIFNFINKDLPIVLLFHDFTFRGKHNMNYFNHFVEQCSNDNNIEFVTLREVKNIIR